METDADIRWPFLETMVEGVCSSPTGETKMAQTSTKRASWRPSTCSGSRPSQGKVAFGPYCQGDSRKGWARANSWREDRTFIVVVATHTETLSVRGIREPLPWLRLFRIKNRTLTLLLPVINPINRFFFWELTPNLLPLNASLSFAWGGVFPVLLDHLMSFCCCTELLDVSVGAIHTK